MSIRVAAYCRVSTEKDNQNDSLENQVDFFQKKITEHEDWELAEIYSDKGVSGTTVHKRKGFLRMIDDAKDGKFDLIIMKDISRFARNILDSIKYTRELRKMGIGVFFLLDGINTLESDGEMRFSIMATFAQEESRKISERVKFGQKNRMERGSVFGCKLLGYDKPEKGVLSINKEEAEIVRMIFQKYLYEKKGTLTIARELYEANIKTKNNLGRWSNSMILKVLRNEKYVGDLLQKKTITPDYISHEKVRNLEDKEKYIMMSEKSELRASNSLLNGVGASKITSKNDKEPYIYIRDHHEPIIDRVTWDAVQAELKRRSPSEEQKIKYSNRYWCSGKLICGDCGSRLISRSKKLKNGEIYKSWRCIRAANHGTKKLDLLGNEVGCNLGSINHIVLGNIVNYVLSSISNNKDEIISELIQEIRALKKPQKYISPEPFLKKIDEIMTKKHILIDKLVEGVLTNSDYDFANKKYDLEIDSLRREIKMIEEEDLVNRKQVDTFQIYIERINSIVYQMNAEDMDEVYKEMVQKVILHDHHIVELYLTCMPNPIKLQYSSSGKNGDYEMEYKLINVSDDMPF